MTDWYRRQTEELRAKQEYDEERERTGRPVTPTQPASMPTPWEGITETAKAFGINLGELWQTREHELNEARQAADGREKELHELRLKEIDRRVEDLQKLAATTVDTLHPVNNPGSNRSRMDDAIDKLIADRIESILGGPQQQLTKEDIKEIATKAVQEGSQNQQSPQQIVDSLMGFITAADTAKKRMTEIGGGGQANGSPYLNQAGNMRGDVLKILLENDRETLKLKNDYAIQSERTKHLGGLAGAVKDNLEDLIGASRDMVREHRESKREQPEDEGGYSIKCSLCGKTSIFPEKPESIFECPKCGGKLKLQEPAEPPAPLSSGDTGLEI